MPEDLVSAKRPNPERHYQDHDEWVSPIDEEPQVAPRVRARKLWWSTKPGLLRRRLTAAAVILAIVAAAFLSNAEQVRRLTSDVPEIERVVALLGFGLDQVTVTGQRFAHPGDILDALDLDAARTFISFDARQARSKVEAMPWIEKVEFRRVYPNQLKVQVFERKPFAVWKQGPKVSLIDEDGLVLTQVEEASAPRDLPRFSGEMGNKMARELWGELGQFPKLKNVFESADYVGKRRWDVRLANGVVVQLPDSGVSDALKQVAQWPGFRGLLMTGDAVVDLRAQGRIAVRPGVSIGVTSSGPQSIADLLKPAG